MIPTTFEMDGIVGILFDRHIFDGVLGPDADQLSPAAKDRFLNLAEHTQEGRAALLALARAREQLDAALADLERATGAKCASIVLFKPAEHANA